jgi:hypothetical protein
MKHLRISTPLVAGAFALIAVGLTTGSPAYAATTRYEAETAARSGGAVVATDHTGFSGAGFIGGYVDANRGTARTSFTVTATTAGTYTLGLGYADGNADARTLTLTVDGGAAQSVTLAPTGSWDTWSKATSSITLSAGSHAVAYSFGAADTANVNLDYVDVTTPATGGSSGQLEAENAGLTGGATVATDHTGYTGSGFVGGFTDGNKGTAAATFTTNSTIAGTAPVTVRYANGNGSAKTLSVYVNATLAEQISLPATATWDTWATAAELLTLRAGANTVAYRFDSADTGNVNLDNIVVGPTVATPPPTSPPPTSPPPTGGVTYQAETAFFAGGPSVSGSTLAGFTAIGARAVFTVNSSGNAATAVNLRYSGGGTLHVYVNGAAQHQVSLPSTGSVATDTLNLRTGLNTITYQNDSGDNGAVSLDYLHLPTGAAMAARGATVPYEEQEAENGSTNATLVGPDRAYLSQAAEASGRKAVKLSANGQYVQFTLTRPANSIVVRYAIPDTADGAEYTPTLGMYVNGSRARSLTLTNRYSWVYGAYPYTNAPSGGNGHHFYDEVRTLTGTMPAGTVVKLQKDATDTAGSYLVDLVDFEQVDAAYPMPAGFLSITSYGAVANDGTNDTSAITTAVAAARSQGKGLWVPSGQFEINAHVNLADVTLRGAGPWYSILHGANGLGGLFATGSKVQILDLGISGDVTYRDDSAFHTAIEGNFGTGSMVQNVWMEHAKVGMWPDTGTNGLYVGGVRIRDTMADGVNLHAGVANTTLTQSSVRGTGDDGLAMFSEGQANTNDAFTFDTVQAPVLANTVGIYGGSSLRVEDNLLADTVTAGAGIAISTRFGPTPFAGTQSVRRNTLTRTGSLEPNWNSKFGAIWIYADTSDITTPVVVDENTINDSTYSGLLISFNKTITNLSLDHDTINGTGNYGIEIQSAGSGSFSNVVVTGAAAGGLSVSGGFTVNRGSGNSGW